MSFYVLDKSIVGYKNVIKNSKSQDYLKIEKIDDSLICTIADGHSGDYFTNSHKGAKLACEVAIDIIKKYIKEETNQIKFLLDSKIIQREICNEWRSLVELDMKEHIPRAYKYNYFKYATTLLITLIKSDYILCLKLGDGEILFKENKKIKKIFPCYRKKKVDSLADENCYDEMTYVIEKIEKNEDNISDIIMFSDGFENSFKSFSNMVQIINNTILKYKQNVFSKYMLEKTYDKYLKELSEKNSFDDISIIFVNIL
ncbi:protein phosphatase 2C domain-containing protein [Terrisporobacter sp.]